MNTVSLQAVNAATRYVRITGITGGGFVEFQFSIGDPTLYLEMILPKQAFDLFCQEQRAVHLSGAQARVVDADKRKWRDGPHEDARTETSLL
jgi:phenol hydroxylase P0 protein